MASCFVDNLCFDNSVFCRLNFSFSPILAIFVRTLNTKTSLELFFLIISFLLCSVSFYLLVKARKSIRENKKFIARQMGDLKKSN